MLPGLQTQPKDSGRRGSVKETLPANIYKSQSLRYPHLPKTDTTALCLICLSFLCLISAFFVLCFGFPMDHKPPRTFPGPQRFHKPKNHNSPSFKANLLSLYSACCLSPSQNTCTEKNIISRYQLN